MTQREPPPWGGPERVAQVEIWWQRNDDDQATDRCKTAIHSQDCAVHYDEGLDAGDSL